MRLLLIEDEPELATLTRAALERSGFTIDLAPDLATGNDHLTASRYDVLILDLALPDGDGLSLLRRVRARGMKTPILILTARDGLDERVIGLEGGADDYLIKPFHMPELVARIRALLRRPETTFGMTLSMGKLVMDTATRQVSVAGRDASLTLRETMLLEQFLRYPGKVRTREALEQTLYSYDMQLGSNALEVLVHRLRRKLDDAGAELCVHTVRGVGYVLTPAG